MSSTRLIPLAATVLFALTQFTANASLVGLTYEQIKTQADLILLGTVTGTSQGISISTIGVLPCQNRHISVQRYYKGTGPENIDVRELGGSLGGGVDMWVEDQPELQVGATYVLFITMYDGYYSVLSGPQGALRVEDGVASNFSYTLQVSDSGLTPLKAEGIFVTGVQNRTYPVAKDPADLEIHIGEITEPGYWTFNTTFTGVSGEAAGRFEEQAVSYFIHAGPSFVVFSHNFTALGTYCVAVDGVDFGSVEVRPPQPQLILSWASFNDVWFAVDEPVTLRVGSIPADMTGEYKAVAVVTPKTEGIEPFYLSYAMYSSDMDWFTFHFIFREAGNYTVSIWQGGVKQLTRSISVGPVTSTGVGVANPYASSEAAEAAEIAARGAQDREDGGNVPAENIALALVTTLAFLAFSAYLFFRVVRK